METLALLVDSFASERDKSVAKVHGHVWFCHALITRKQEYDVVIGFLNIVSHAAFDWYRGREQWEPYEDGIWFQLSIPRNQTMRVTIKYARGPVYGQFECDYAYDKGKFSRLDQEHAEERSFHQLMTDLCWRANLEMYEKTANTRVIYQIHPVPLASQTSPSAGQQTLRQYVEAHHLNIFGNNKGRRMVLFCMPCWCYVFIWVWLKYALSSPRYFIPLFAIVCLLLSWVADVTLPDWAYLRNFTATKRLLRQ